MFTANYENTVAIPFGSLMYKCKKDDDPRMVLFKVSSLRVIGIPSSYLFTDLLT